jgi:hypothetical protein
MTKAEVVSLEDSRKESKQSTSMPGKGNLQRKDNQRPRKSRDALTTGSRNIWHGSLICQRNAKSSWNAKDKEREKKDNQKNDMKCGALAHAMRAVLTDIEEEDEDTLSE